MTANPRRKALLAGAGALTGAAIGAFVLPRLAARRLRSRPDAGAAGALEPIVHDSRRVASHDGGTIHVVENGAGPPIVLSHGVTLSVRTWTYQLAALAAAGHRVIAFDHRGHGGSKLGTGGHSIENLGWDIRSVLEQLDLRDAVLVGHSMGGIAVQSFVLDHPDVARERVRGIVLLSTIARLPVNAVSSAQMRRRLERFSRRVPDSTMLWASPDIGLLLARVGFGVDPHPSHVELVRRMMLECPADTRRDSPAALLSLAFADRLREIAVPTLVICGTHDRITPLGESRRIAGKIPGARLEVVAGGGHMLMLERTELVDRLILDFAREVGAGAGATGAALPVPPGAVAATGR